MIPAGTKITCPECHKVLFLTRVDLCRGMRIEAGYFIPVDNHPIEYRTPMACSLCGAGFFDGCNLHTENGWMSG